MNQTVDQHEWRNKWTNILPRTRDFNPGGQYHGNVNETRDFIVEFISIVRNAEREIRTYEQNVGLELANVGLDCASIFLQGLLVIAYETIGQRESIELFRNEIFRSLD